MNDVEVRPYEFALRKSAEFEPVRRIIEDPESGVMIEIIAGMSGIPPMDLSPEEEASKEAGYYGWFVCLNDRIVVPADKTDLTVWGHDGFPRWHPQYNGFMGIAALRAADPRQLPWTTTKRSIEATDPLYRRAVTEMKEVTRQYIDYTNARKEREEEARPLEQRSELTPIKVLPANPNLRVPAFLTPRRVVAHISYVRPKAEVLEVAEALGNRNLSYKEVGIRTFDYYRNREIGS